jgi:peptidoglycan/LPS O-acetylase OafA/YrhL/lysophospholipase L1-like esterase
MPVLEQRRQQLIDLLIDAHKLKREIEYSLLAAFRPSEIVCLELELNNIHKYIAICESEFKTLDEPCAGAFAIAPDSGAIERVRGELDALRQHLAILRKPIVSTKEVKFLVESRPRLEVPVKEPVAVSLALSFPAPTAIEVIAKPKAPAPARAAHLPYMAGLNGLRAIAVLAVLLYHANLSWMPGGFLGVEIFFVISGYLITALLLGEWQQRNRIDFKAFWLRRARRLLPALFLLLGVTLVYAVIFLPEEVAGLRWDTLAAFGYVTNWYLILENKSYFESFGRPSLLKHLWSLAVEEQFYLLWPLLFSAGMMFLRKRRMWVAILLGIAASTLLMALLYQPDSDPSRLYYGTDTRAAGLLVGAALAFVWVPSGELNWKGRRSQLASWALNLAGLGALGVLAWFFLQIDQYQPFLYQGGFLVVSLTTALLIAVVVHPLAHLGPGVLDWPPIRWVGLRSYSIYLWHWPVYTITRPQLDLPLEGWPLLALRWLITGVLAELSYRYVEVPVRTGKLESAWRNWRETRSKEPKRFSLGFTGATAGIAACILALGIVVASAQPPLPPSYLVASEIGFDLTPTATPDSPVGTAGPELSPVSSNIPAIATMLPETVAPTITAVVALPAATPTALPEVTPTTLPEATPTATPKPTPVPTAPPPPTPTKAGAVPGQLNVGQVTALGDSIMLGAAPELRRDIANLQIYAKVSRFFFEGTDILRQLRSAGELGDVVIVHLGSNGGISSKQFDDMMKQLSGVRRVIFVNVKAAREWEAPNNRIIADGVQRYPNAVLVDWHGATVDHPELFWDDGVHPRPEGAKLYASLIAAHLKGLQ